MEKYVVVVGAVNIDIGGKSTNELINRDSNIGKVSLSLGGVGRNIAHNISLLDIPVKFITCLGEDVYAHKVKQSCKELNIDLSHSLFSEDINTSTYMFIANNNGEMEVAVADMEIYQLLTPQFISTRMNIINNASAVVLDTNISQDTIEYICKHATVPIIVDTVSTAKAVKLKGCLSYIDTIKPNIYEAELLTGIKVVDEQTLKSCANRLLELGVKNVFITLSEKGVYFANSQTRGSKPIFVSRVVNVTGAGDCFVASLVYARMNNFDIEKTATFALGASSIKVESSDTINSNISVASINLRIKE